MKGGGCGCFASVRRGLACVAIGREDSLAPLEGRAAIVRAARIADGGMQAEPLSSASPAHMQTWKARRTSPAAAIRRASHRPLFL